MSARSDAELLGLVARAPFDRGGQGGGAEARAAQAAFYERHVRYLHGVLTRTQRAALASAGLGAEDLVQETFERAFARAATFDAGGIDPREEPDRARARTRAWLGRIATTLLVDRLGRTREIAASPLLEQVTAPAVDDDPPPSEPPRVKLVAAGLESLSERERDVLAVSALHYRAGEHQRLPNDVSADLAARWATTNENIRAIRARAMKKLREFIDSRSKSPERTDA
jgi:DNA-directed RNA polymerase specialized sigma24 family protein